MAMVRNKERCKRPIAHLHKLYQQNPGNSRLPGPGKPVQKYRKTLPEARRKKTLQLIYNLRIRSPAEAPSRCRSPRPYPPQRLPWPRLPAGKGRQPQLNHIRRKDLGKRLVTPNQGIIVQIPGMRQICNRMQKHRSPGLPGRSKHHFTMRAMQIHISMKTQHPPPAVHGKAPHGL